MPLFSHWLKFKFEHLTHFLFINTQPKAIFLVHLPLFLALQMPGMGAGVVGWVEGLVEGCIEVVGCIDIDGNTVGDVERLVERLVERCGDAS